MRLISLLLCTCVLCGCSAKYLETQQYSLDNIPQKENYGKGYCIIKVVSGNYSLTEEQSKFVANEAMTILKRKVPNWFTDDENSVPIIVSHEYNTQKETLYPVLWITWISLPTLFTIPTHLEDVYLHKISIIGKGGSRLKQLDYEWKLKGTVCNPVSACFYSDEWENKVPSLHNSLSPNYIDIKRICGPIAYAVQSLTPMERRLVENNDEAWYLDAKYGNKRSKTISIKEDKDTNDGTTLGVDISKKYSSSFVNTQEWDYNTNDGYVIVSLPDFTDVEAAQQWIINDYLPEYCSLLGVATTGERQSNSGKPKIKVLDIKIGENDTLRVDFRLLE